MADDDGFITLPPGIADSGTHRRPRPERTVRPEHDEIIFVPAVPGPLIKQEPVVDVPQLTEPVPDSPVFTAPPASVAPASVAPVAAPPVVAASPATEDDAGETRVSISRHAAPGWRLTIPGTVGPVTVDTPLFLGRNPAPTIAGAKALGVEDPAKSLSKTHALLEVDGGVLYVSDLDSTNGVWVVPADGEAVEVVPGQRMLVPAGADLELGDVVIQVEHG